MDDDCRFRAWLHAEYFGSPETTLPNRPTIPIAVRHCRHTLNNRPIDRSGLARQIPSMPETIKAHPNWQDQYRETFSGKKALSIDFDN